MKGYRSGAVGRLFPKTYMHVRTGEFIETTAPLPHMLQKIKETLQGALFFLFKKKMCYMLQHLL